ncbi:hypothetical protein R3P38DRAFT_3281563 [Favolaschia claudopus]|uniref:Clu domain-containing protein n=1 Tax=Favolaschia claudopus TaxID=2862362 RepID=A0AAW0AFB5_9AGAR
MAARRRASNLQSASSASRAIVVQRGQRRNNRDPQSSTEVLTKTQIQIRKAVDERDEAARRAALTAQQRHDENAVRDLPDLDGDMTWEDYEDDVLHGRTAADISHAGEALNDEEVEDAEQKLLEELRAHHHKLYGRRVDYRTRRDRTQILVDGFAAQLPQMVDAYLAWSLDTAKDGLGKLFVHPEDAVVEDNARIYVVDLFSACFTPVPIVRGDQLITSAFVRQGLIPATPNNPSVAITIRTLEVFRATQLRCPRLGTQAFVRTLCDLHGVPPRPYLGRQFGIAYDLYLDIRAAVDKRVLVALGRDSPNWRLKNACPACLYKLEGESSIPLPILGTIDGNNSLKRFWRREREQVRADGTTAPGASKEYMDNRVAPGDYYLTRQEVDEWAKDGPMGLVKDFVPGSSLPDEGDGCTERWQNMSEDATARSYGMYDETGIFPALCRHGFVFVVADMVKSGELAKYGFAVVAHLLRELGELAIGYDCGCNLKKMVKAHPVLSKIAADNNFVSLVGAFHGHAHNRLCQLSNLSLYVEGVGLEDLEGCESFFSKSNALAATTRYSTVFHRQQAIATYMRHADAADAYQGLSLMIANKYRRALKIKETLPALQASMAALGVRSRSDFGEWLGKEREYLVGLRKEPEQETLEMEYYQKLVNLREYAERVESIRNVPVMVSNGETTYAAAAAETRRIETQRRHAMELYMKTLRDVQDLEVRLGITLRWESEGEAWIAAATMLRNRRFQRAIDQLEGLVVARMFELAKVNLCDTGYKLRKHIAKALQVRSKAVKTALDRYNDAATALDPPRPQLSWEEIVNYAFLTEFDLLREGRQDIRTEAWAQPAGRVAMDQHFKLLRADEEIARLNLEIRRLITHMQDETAFLLHHQRRLVKEGDAALAHQVHLYRMERGRYNDLHRERLQKLSKECGFTGSLSPGVSVDKQRRVPHASGEDVEMPDVSSPPTVPGSTGGDEGLDDGAEVDVEAVADALEHILRIAQDVPSSNGLP